MEDDVLELESFFNEHKGDSKTIKDADDLMNIKYIQLKEDPDGFKLNERALYKPDIDPFFVPGKMYTFNNAPKGSEKYDSQPIILATSSGIDKKKGLFVNGLNFNYLIPEIKVEVLARFQSYFESEFQESFKSAQKGETYISKEIIAGIMTQGIMEDLMKGINVNCYSKYFLADMKNPTLIELDDWKLVPFFSPLYFIGTSIDELDKYYKAMREELIQKKLGKIVKDASNNK